ncbi:hypothetical protein ACTWP6_16290 [Mycobacterium sp. 4D054]|uniref:hypothetical protein n=1 Tax=unclassified Mycobacterium TaxID=2642494 RepID=UPI0021B1D34C|nr:hypothetical protein [Mycobacterium sp. SMC-8]UXA13313.1 hypothetical protein KXD97_05665 [Mycobacterium sp. SMC-8]
MDDDTAAPPSLLISAYRTCEALPLVGGLFTRGRQEAHAVLSVVVAAVVDELDLDEMVRERITAETVDAVIARIDVVALADKVIDGVDLRAIIRESTALPTVDPDTLAGFVDRMRGRRSRFRDRS